MSPTVGVPDQFELVYTANFKARLAGRGLFINYEVDRSAIDIGLHLFWPTVPGAPARPSLTKVWFQLKGKTKQALSADELAHVQYIPCGGLSVETVRFWLASPEAVYL
jgi:hypothetical protein